VQWIYLSPHFDDIALSCGGLLWEQARAGRSVQVWTVCAGDPERDSELSEFAQALHRRWGSGPEAVVLRRGEDIASCERMGAGWRHFALPDCIYRQGKDGEHLYASEQGIFDPLHAEDLRNVQALRVELAAALPEGAALVCPLALGGHVDHKLTRQAAEMLGRALWYYLDYPYVLRQAEQIPSQERHLWQAQVFPVSQEGLSAWGEAVAAHESQISTFWGSLKEMRRAIEAYWQVEQGVQLWRRRQS
jgi:LmbE family N-acetylglucosaminyl deacetylase